MSRHNGVIKTAGLLLIIAACAAAAFFCWKLVKQKDNGSVDIEKRTSVDPEYRIVLLDNPVSEATSGISAVNVLDGDVDGEILIAPDKFKKEAALTSAKDDRKASASAEVKASVKKDDILVCQFTAYTEDRPVTLKVTCGSAENRVYLKPTPTTYYMPISGVSSVREIDFLVESEFQKMTIDSVYLVNYGSSTDIDKLLTGAYTHDERSSDNIAGKSITDEYSTQCLIKDGYLFSIYDGSIYSYALDSDGGTEKTCELSGLGTTRDMTFNKDQTAILVTCRQNGMYIIDITDPENMSVISHYDTLEAATGIDVNGDYAFVCSRFFGVEFVDISDLENPRYINKVQSSSEYQDCFSDGQYLYVGAYANKRVDIFDISDLGFPEMVSQIELDGAGQGCFVKDDILYAATSLNSNNDSSSRLSYGTGTGNGLELYDVSDPAAPVLLSVTKTNGRSNDNRFDVWDVQVSGNYAFVTDIYNGVYVYDVSDPYDPVCLREINLSINKKSENFEEANFDKYVYPWDAAASGRGNASHVAVEDGKIYISMANAGVFGVKDKHASAVDRDRSYEYEISPSKDKTEVEGYSVSSYSCESSIWAADVKGDYIFVAAGDEGIKVLDKELNEVNVLDTDHSVRDVKIYDNYLFTAESCGGVSAYLIDGMYLSKLSTAELAKDTDYASQIMPTADGKYIIAQISPSRHTVIDASDVYNLTVTDIRSAGAGTLYYRNICTGVVADKYMGVFGKTGICWYSYENGEIKALDPTENPYYREAGGMTAVGDKCVAITGGGYKYFKVGEDNASGLVTVSDTPIAGKAANDGNTMVVSCSYDGTVTIIDISELDDPYLEARFTIEGNPDIAYVSDEMILIPCRYGGLLKLTKEN